MVTGQSTPLRCSICVTAHNEEANLAKLLDALLNQDLHLVEISEIVVVASGCTDRTVEIADSFRRRDPRIKVLVQEKREGKTAAINLFLRHAAEDICVVESGDTLPGLDTIEHLIKPFADPSVGMTGAQKVPTNASNQFVGYVSHLRLRLEHQLCLEIPRLGELIAFRKVFDRIPPDVAMDEAFVEAFVVRRGQQVKYAPQAVVYNAGPMTVGDFIKQRRRNHAGHLYLRHKYGYKVSSLNTRQVAWLALEELGNVLRVVVWMLWAGGLEFVSRILGAYDYYVKKDKHVVWDMAWTTKEVDVSRVQGPPPSPVSPAIAKDEG